MELQMSPMCVYGGDDADRMMFHMIRLLVQMKQKLDKQDQINSMLFKRFDDSESAVKSRDIRRGNLPAKMGK